MGNATAAKLGDLDQIKKNFDKKWQDFLPNQEPLCGIHWGKDTELLLSIAQRLLDLEQRVGQLKENE